MTWDPIRPLEGAGDALERVRVAPERLPQDALHAARQVFRPDGDGLLVLKSVFADAPARRLALVEDLLRLLEMGRRRRGGYVVEPAVQPLLQTERARLS